MYCSIKKKIHLQYAWALFWIHFSTHNHQWLAYHLNQNEIQTEIGFRLIWAIRMEKAISFLNPISIRIDVIKCDVERLDLSDWIDFYHHLRLLLLEVPLKLFAERVFSSYCIMYDVIYSGKSVQWYFIDYEKREKKVVKCTLHHIMCSNTRKSMVLMYACHSIDIVDMCKNHALCTNSGINSEIDFKLARICSCVCVCAHRLHK